MITARRAAVAVLLLASAPASAQSFSKDRIKSDIAFLADDLLEGRNAGDRGYDVAARWVAARYEALGLTPGGTSGYFQTVPFSTTRVDPARPSAITINGKRLTTGKDVIVTPSALTNSIDEQAEVVFVGYGLDDPRYKLDDYRGLDVKGKVVAYLYGTPGDVPSDVAATLNERKGELAAAKGAIGTIVVATPALLDRFPWERLLENVQTPRLRWIETSGKPHIDTPAIRLGAFLSPSGAAGLFGKSPQSWDQIAATIKDKNARPRGFVIPGTARFERYGLTDRTRAPNVIGVIPGSDPRLANEVVMLSAHLDHDGIVPAKNGDTIMNGAMDNAAGVATMLEAARAFVDSGQAPKRTIMFVALAAEEDGLLGSQYLAEYPTLAGKKVVANVNLDMPILTYDFTDVIAFGAEHSTLGQAVDHAVSKIGVTLSPDPIPEEGLFTRSDHYSFVRKGIPSVFLVTGYGGPGRAASEDFQKNHYHQVSDDMKLPFNWDAGAKFAKVNYMIAREIADAPAAPRWYQGSFFGDKFAAGQPKAPKP